MEKDLYDILEISRTASNDEIRQAYKKLTKVHYPTLHGGSTHEFQLLSRAYRVLMDDDKRRIYNFSNDVIQADSYNSQIHDIESLCSLEYICCQ